MLRVVALGFEAAPTVPADVPPIEVTASLDGAGLDKFVAMLQDLVADDAEAVVIYPSWLPEPTPRHLHTARSALGDVGMALYASELPPLAGNVFVSLVAALAPLARSSGALVSGLERIEAQLLVVAWLFRVSGLNDPAPSLWQHALSWLPWTAFGVSSWPEPSIRVLRAKDRDVSLPAVASGALRLAVANRDGDLGWVREAVAPALGTLTIDETAATSLGPGWWGTRRLVEVVAYPADIDMLASRLDRIETAPCRSCGREAAVAGSCGFCDLAMVVPRLHEVAAAESEEIHAEQPLYDLEADAEVSRSDLGEAVTMNVPHDERSS